MSLARLLSIWLAGTLLASCASVPTPQFTSFSSATSDFADNSETTYKRLQAIVSASAVLDAPDVALTADSFKEEKSLPGYVRAMSARLDVIEKYAKALECLASKDPAADIESAATDLSASANSLGKVTNHISPEAANYAGTLADMVGRWATYNDRKNGLEEAMKKAQPALVAFAREIEEDSGDLKTMLRLVRDNYLLHANKMRPPYQTWSRAAFDSSVASQLNEYRDLGAALDAMTAAAKQLPAANSELLQSVQQGTASRASLINFARQVRQIRAFYRGLPTT